MYDAFSAKQPRKRVRLAKEALKISPDCADAYVLLGEETSKTLGDARDFYRAGVAAGERALGPEEFELYAGDFWVRMSTRPYMRALYNLGQVEARLGNFEEAISIGQRLLELNPIDNQEVRYQLLALLLIKADAPAIHILLRKFRDDEAADWAYGRALVAFLEHGNTRHARAKLQEALYRNIYFPCFLCGTIPLPETAPRYIEPGTEAEGLSVFFNQSPAWLAHQRSLDLMTDIIERTPTPARRGMRSLTLPGR